MKVLMGLKIKGNSDLVKITEKQRDSEMSQLVNFINEFQVSVTREMPTLDELHAIFHHILS